MFRSTKIAGFLLVLSVMGTSPVMAQISAPQQQQQQQKIEVSDEELSRFAQAFQGIRVVNQQAQQQMSSLIQDEGMEVQRFNEIHQASMNPAVEVEATEEEKEQHQKIVGEIQKMQGSFQGQMEEIIKKEGMTLERYQQIAASLQTDPELQERLRQSFQG